MADVDVEIARLHRYYREGRLRILVGAGVSMAAGFPGWQDLNRLLVDGWIRETSGLSPAEQTSLAEQIINALSNDEIADFIWQQCDPGRGGSFFQLLAHALYGT
ncbi:MAG TPA: hypothetical protein VGM88_05100 [Kofleriaceae bacterium]|jgi:hypothetical protein